MNTNKSLYFIAIVPPDPIYEDIFKWKTYFADNHQSKGALRSPPHITLHMPFKSPEKKSNKIHEFLQSVASEQKPFVVQLRNFNAFEPRVIYIDILDNTELRTLQNTLAASMRRVLNIFNDGYKNKGFKPHITVAFRDLRKAEFYNAWKTIKDEVFEAAFEVKELCLLKHDGQRWEINTRYPFRSSPENSH
ncbi:MAG: 2'-5' RNA ligase family protein [Bacteroidota bacterium]